MLGVLCWGISASRVFGLQKKAIRNITRSKYNAHTEPLFKTYYLLKLRDIMEMKSWKFYYKYTHNMVPGYFNEIFQQLIQITPYQTRQHNMLQNQQPNKTSCFRTIRYTIPQIIDKYPFDIKNKVNTVTYDGFSQHLKRYIIGQYRLECRIINCYICERMTQ